MPTAIEIRQLLTLHRQQLAELAQAYGILRIRLFGSTAKGAETVHDIDLLVKLAEGCSLMDFIGFKLAAEELLGMRVDVVSEEGLHWYIRDEVLGTAVEL